MSRALNLVRAAQLVGVPRATLQRMTRAGELQAHDGFIDIDELRRAFPGRCYSQGAEVPQLSSLPAATASHRRPATPAAPFCDTQTHGVKGRVFHAVRKP